MSTGPEHYREAERLIEESGDPESVSAVYRERLVATAQVHATLALAAATAAGDRLDPALEWPAAEKLNEAWGEVLS